jgi:tetratricopeptide (TPR) repeat protein
MAASMSEARRSSETFTRFGDITRFAAARLAEVAMLMASADYESALELLWRLDAQMRHTADANTHARVLGNLGYCYAKLGKINEALRYNDAAAMLFDEIGVRTEAVRLRWTTATVLASAGRIDEAYSRLDHLKEAFDDLVMTSEAALVRLDIADILLSRGQYSSVEAICREAMRSFETSGVTYTPRALTALAYIQETARARSATPALVRHVREYIRRLPQDGELLFAPPPLDDFS